jgi:3-methyladenine DNA glycosylase/8-oxoguanine DNA glycosylase
MGPVSARAEVVPASPLRLGSGGREGTARRRGDALTRLVHLRGAPVVLEARPAAGGALALSAQAPTAEAAGEGLARLRFWTGVDDDLRPFLRRFRDDPLIGHSVRTAPWVRPWRRPTPFEVLMWAVCEQLVTDERAVAITRAIVSAHGPRDPASGLRDAPGPEAVAALSPALLQRCGLSAGRARALIAAAREVASGRVDLDAPPPGREAALRRLRAIPGIGPWTLAVLAFHGLGDHDAIPAGDFAYLTLVGELRTGRRRAQGTEQEVMALVAPYSGWRGLAGLHLLRVGSRAITVRGGGTLGG